MSVPEAQQHDNVRPACAACKHQRRKCAEDCVFAEHFPADKTDDFKAALEVFGVKSMAKMLKSLGSKGDRERAVQSIVWEAAAWKKDPVNGPFGELRRVRDKAEALQERALPLPYMTGSGLIGVSNANEGITQGNYCMTDNSAGLIGRVVKLEHQMPSCNDANSSGPYHPADHFPMSTFGYNLDFNQTQVIGGHGQQGSAQLVCYPGALVGNYPAVVVGAQKIFRQGHGRENVLFNQGDHPHANIGGQGHHQWQ